MAKRPIEYQILRLIIGIALAIGIGSNLLRIAHTPYTWGTYAICAMIGLGGAWLLEMVIFTGLVEHSRYILPFISSSFRIIGAIGLYQLIFFIGGLMALLNLLISVVSGSDAESIRFPAGLFISNALEMDSFLKKRNEKEIGAVGYFVSVFMVALTGVSILVHVAHSLGVLILLSQLMNLAGIVKYSYSDKQEKLKRRARKRKLAKKR